MPPKKLVKAEFLNPVERDELTDMFKRLDAAAEGTLSIRRAAQRVPC